MHTGKNVQIVNWKNTKSRKLKKIIFSLYLLITKPPKTSALIKVKRLTMSNICLLCNFFYLLSTFPDSPFV